MYAVAYLEDSHYLQKTISLILKAFQQNWLNIRLNIQIEDWVNKSLNIHIMKYHADFNIYAGIKNYVLNNTENREMSPK